MALVPSQATVIMTAFFLLFPTLQASANSGITYHGRIMRPDGVTPVNSPSTQFRIQVRAPATGCLLWEEQQTKDLSQTQGVFSITIADTTEPSLIANTLPFTLERVFSNRSTFTGLTSCIAGTTYAPNPADGRSLQVWFRENPTDPWEQMPATKVNFVPLSLNSVQLEGYRADEFLQLQSGVTQSPLSQVQVNTLLQVLNGGAGSPYIAKTDTFAGDVSGTSSSTSVDRIRGVNVLTTTPASGQVLKFNGTAWAPAADDNSVVTDATYAAKGVVQVDNSLAVSGLNLTSGVLSLPNVIAAGGPTGTAQSIPVISYDSKGRLTTVSTVTVDDTTKLPLAGGTMTGSINMGGQNISNAATITATNLSSVNVSTRNVILSDTDTNTATIRAPNDIPTNYTLTLPVAAPTNGYVLSTDATGNLSWIAPSAGSVTSLTSTNSYLTVAGTATVPTLTVNVGTIANTVAAGDDARIVNSVQQTAYANDLALVNACAGNEKPYWNTVNDRWECTTITGFVTTTAGFVQNGNSFAASAVLGTNDNQPLNFETNGTTKMTVLANGNVGVGTTNPQTSFHLASGDLSIQDPGDSTVRGIYFTPSDHSPRQYIQGYQTGTPPNDFLRLGSFYGSIQLATGDPAAPTPRLTIENAGKVGIGTTNPAAQLEVSVAGYTPSGFRLTDTTNPSNSLTISNFASGSGLIFDSQANGGNFYFGRNNTLSNFIIQSGNVGVGTQTPATRLDVAGGVRIGSEGAACAIGLAGTLRYNGSAVEYCNGSAWQAFGVSGAGLTSLNSQTGSTQTFATGSTGLAPAFSSGSNIHTLNIPLASAAGVTSGTISKSDYDNFNSKLGTALTNGQIWIGNGSNVATAQPVTGDVTISNSGVTDLGAGVVVDADISATAAIARTKIASGTANHVLINDGTGVMSSEAQLAVSRGGTGASSFTANRIIASNGTGSALTSFSCGLNEAITFDGAGMAQCSAVAGTNAFVNNGNSFGGIATLGTNDNFALNFETNGTNKMSILANGNVGIGTTNPSSQLEVSGGNITVYTSGARHGFTAVSPIGTNTVNLNAEHGVGILEVYDPANSVRKGLWLNATGLSITNGGLGPSTNVNRLDVEGGAAIGSYANVNSAPTNGLIVSGNVGVGTATPAERLDINGNLMLSGAGARIRGDFSNATIANRVAFQTSVTNGNTNFSFLPNGTSDVSAINTYSMSDPTNSPFGSFGINNAAVIVGASRRGTGAFLPISFQTNNGTERMRIEPNTGNVGIGTASPSARLTVAGAINTPTTTVAASTVDLASSNTHTLATVGGSTITLQNLANGATYNIIVEDSTSRTYAFSGCTNTFWKPAAGPTTAGTRTIFGVMTIQKGANWDCYVTWSTGFQ